MFLDPQTQATVDQLEPHYEAADDIVELLGSALLNCEQLWKFASALKGDAAYAMTIVQIRTAIKMLEARNDS